MLGASERAGDKVRSLGLVRAISLAGTQAALASALQRVAPSVKQQHVSYWLAHGVPIRRAQQIVQVLPAAGPVADFYVDVGDAVGCDSL